MSTPKETPQRIENPQNWRVQLFRFIDNEDAKEENIGSKIFEMFITILIILSIVSIILESFANLREQYYFWFKSFESITLVIFTGEYFARLITADLKYSEEKSFRAAVWRFITSAEGIIDFVAISPFVFALYDIDFRFLRALKISRLLRVLKLSSLTQAIGIVGNVFMEKKGELGITLFVTFILLLVSATLMWHIEGGPHTPEGVEEQFPNIIATFWWAIATLTTVGYGDVYPVTPWGKVLSGIIAVLGIGMVALPAGILSSAFIEKLEASREQTLQRMYSERFPQRDVDDREPDAEDPAPHFGRNDWPAHTPIRSDLPLISPKEHSECNQYFGQQFRYCPYCGKQLDAKDPPPHT